MLTVKATYHSETRKIVLNSDEFPTYQTLQDELYRVFPISHNVYLSRVLFSPSGDNSGRILLILEAHNESEYESHVKLYRRQKWPGAILRFSVFDETPHKLPSIIAPLLMSTLGNDTRASPGTESMTTSVGTGFGPELPTPRPRLRSLLEQCSQRSQERIWHARASLDNHRRTLPPPPIPRRYPYAASGLPWLRQPPSVLPVTAPRSPSLPDVRVEAPTPAPALEPPLPPLPPPPPPMLNHLRPVASLPTLSFDTFSSKNGLLPPPGPPSLPPPPPPPPPPGPMPGFSVQQDSWARLRTPPVLSTPPPPLPAKPFEHRSARGSYRDILERIYPKRPEVGDQEESRFPAHAFNPNPNRYSWDSGDMQVSGLPAVRSISDNDHRRDRIREARERARILADERRRRLATLPGTTWSHRNTSNLVNDDEDSSVDEDQAKAAEPAVKPDNGKGKGRAVELDSTTDESEDDFDDALKRARKLYTPWYTTPVPEYNTPKLSTPLAPTDISALNECTVPLAPTSDSTVQDDVNQCAESQIQTSPTGAPFIGKAEEAESASRTTSDLFGPARSEIEDMRGRFDVFVDSMRRLLDNIESERAGRQPAADAATPAQPIQDSSVAVEETQATPADEPRNNEPKPVHRGVRCDACNRTIEGVRHKCLDCPDYDLCTPCLTASRVTQQPTIQPGEQRVVGGHQDNHIFFAIEEPGDTWLHATFKSTETETRSATVHPANTTGATSAEPSSTQGSAVTRPAQHHAICDLCDSNIVDKRYKCLQCPDWDVCEQCFTIVGDQHPGHGFVLVTDPAALWHHRTIRAAQRPGPYHHARCDECNTGIVGVRYKCMHPACSDYDLCAKCEALPIPVHPPSHPMLKIRSPDALIPSVKRYDEIAPEPVSTQVPEPAVPVASPSPTPPVTMPVRPLTPSRAESPPLPRMPSPPSFLPATSSTLAEERYPPIEAIASASMPGALLPLTPSLPPSPVQPPSPDLYLSHADDNSRLTAAFNNLLRGSYYSPIPTVDAVSAIPPTEGASFATSHHQSPQYFSPQLPSFYPQYPYFPPPMITVPIVPSPTSSRSSSPSQLLPPPLFFPPPESIFVPSSVASPELYPQPLPERQSLIDLAETNEKLIDLTQSSSESQSPSSSRGEPEHEILNLAESHHSEAELAPSLLPQVPQTDLHELFDLAAQFRHLWTQGSSGAGTPKNDAQAKATNEEVISNISPPTELASSHSAASDADEDAPLAGVEDVPRPESTAQSLISAVELLSTPRKQTLRSTVMGTLSDVLRGPSAPSRSSVTDTSSSRPLSFVTDDTSTIVGGQLDALRAAYVADNNIPDGQVFPPGAEFVKSWAMRNDGTIPWPDTTELVFVAGDRLQLDKVGGERFKVGTVYPGEMVDVWTGEMKAPEIPGKYISYWRLSDGQGNRFGHSIWVDITVIEPAESAKADSESSLSSSSIIMPQPQSATSQSQVPRDESMATTVDDDAASSSVSFIDMPSDEEDEDEFVDSRSHAGSGESPAQPQTRSPDVEYVVLYDSSDDEEL